MSARYLPSDRRAVSARPFVARPLQRDRHATQEIVFAPMTLAKATALRDYVRNDLERGGNWFYAAWPIPQGLGGVRRWLAPLQLVNEPGRDGYWRATGVCEIRGAGMLPALNPTAILAMHFDEDLTDLAGRTITPHALPPYTVALGYLPLDLVGNEKFGTGGAHADSSRQVLFSDIIGSLDLARYGEWQITFWTRLEFGPLSYGGGGVISLGGASQLTFGEVGPTPGGPYKQIEVRTDKTGDSSFGQLSVTYNGRDAEDPTIHGLQVMQEVSTGSSLIPIDGQYHFVAIVGDATSVRAYIDTDLALDDHLGAEFPAGSRPLWYDVETPFTEQVFLLMGLHAGSHGSGSEPWPESIALTLHYSGDVDDMRVIHGPGCVEYTGTTITVPTGPF